MPGLPRKDLKPPTYLELDLGQRFPRLRITSGTQGGSTYGPFGSRAAAEGALREMHKRFLLRPCDYVFEPAEDLELGLSCLFAQTRTCSAPCLRRISEEAYADSAREVAACLSFPPAGGTLGKTKGSRALVVTPGIFLYPVLEGVVLEEASVQVEGERLAEALADLRWEGRREGLDDTPWLLDWMRSKKPGGAWMVLGHGELPSPESVFKALEPFASSSRKR
jgi:hypothetical protein